MITVGSKVKFVGKLGYPQEIAVAQQNLQPDTEYTVNFVHHNGPITFLFLDGIQAIGFHAVMFEPVEVTECISH